MQSFPNGIQCSSTIRLCSILVDILHASPDPTQTSKPFSKILFFNKLRHIKQNSSPRNKLTCSCITVLLRTALWLRSCREFIGWTCVGLHCSYICYYVYSVLNNGKVRRRTLSCHCLRLCLQVVRAPNFVSTSCHARPLPRS